MAGNHTSNPDGVKREHVIGYNRDGEEYESEGLIEIEGIGSVLSYKDIYFSTLPFLIVSSILAKSLFGSEDEKFLVYTNCILGVLLIVLTNKSYLTSTILYWGGIIAGSSALDADRKRLL